MKALIYRVAPPLILTLLGLSLFACVSMPPPESGGLTTPPSYSLAQSTLDRGRNELEELSAQGTAVSIEMAQAAATQHAILEQTQFASNAEALALDQAATEKSFNDAATQAAYNLITSQTAQAQLILDIQASQTAQANATGTAFSLTATPLAALQVDLARIQAEADHDARWENYVIGPLKTVVWFAAALLLIAGLVLAYRWVMDAPIPRIRPMIQPIIQPIKRRALQLIKPPRPPRNGTPQVEIVGPSDPSVVNWIAEAEKKLWKRL